MTDNHFAQMKRDPAAQPSGDAAIGIGIGETVADADGVFGRFPGAIEGGNNRIAPGVDEIIIAQMCLEVLQADGGIGMDLAGGQLASALHVHEQNRCGPRVQWCTLLQRHSRPGARPAGPLSMRFSHGNPGGDASAAAQRTPAEASPAVGRIAAGSAWFVVLAEGFNPASPTG